ncbi:hypothetical protein FA95DRAFT_1679693 [Auriscalpium vulgare]|uniref:Uncharacterized protein n=1 Tax=Auriscalpium vulgare TaxID=40419 RepID=A0ACB8RR66_9AGAM|nr:hypothetical protein FA95DRAFT_1679693 [Auriscalpium vulgare]
MTALNKSTLDHSCMSPSPLVQTHFGDFAQTPDPFDTSPRPPRPRLHISTVTDKLRDMVPSPSPRVSRLFERAKEVGSTEADTDIKTLHVRWNAQSPTGRGRFNSLPVTKDEKELFDLHHDAGPRSPHHHQDTTRPGISILKTRSVTASRQRRFSVFLKDLTRPVRSLQNGRRPSSPNLRAQTRGVAQTRRGRADGCPPQLMPRDFIVVKEDDKRTLRTRTRAYHWEEDTEEDEDRRRRQRQTRANVVIAKRYLTARMSGRLSLDCLD